MRNSFIKKLKYPAGDVFAGLFLSFAIPIFRRLSPGGVETASRAMGRIASALLAKYRKRIMSNLSIAFENEKSVEEIRSLAREVFYHLTLTGFETLYGLANPTGCLRNIEIKGKDYLDAALARGRGVLAVGAHLGSFTLLGTRLGMEGYKVNIIIDMGHFPKVWTRINRVQRKCGENPFPSKPVSVSLQKSLNCLRRNEVLYIIADQQQRRGGMAVPFFGKTAYTPPGPAILSLKTGAPVLPMFLLREDAIHRTLVIGKPIDEERTGDERKDIEIMTAKFTEAIEDAVRRYPGQWAWINRRWKQPR